MASISAGLWAETQALYTAPFLLLSFLFLSFLRPISIFVVFVVVKSNVSELIISAS